MKSSFGMVLFATRIPKTWRITACTRCLIFVAVLFQLSTIGAAQTLPYFPTSIFIPQSKPESAQENATADIAYIFSPQGDWVDLLALNFSTNLQASSLSFQTLSSNVPFLDTNSTAFTPSLADNGSLIVYAGDCSAPADSEIWTFYLSSDNGASSWSKANTTLATDADSIQVGPSFLGGGFSFSNILEPQLSPAVTYVYGGMCPGTASNASLAQSNATYSNQMMKIAPSGINPGEFTVSPVSSKGPPIPEAGFTFTGLSPSISNHSGSVTQQVNYVLLGGHTRTAFINMSTVAIWSLPEETWSFISDIDTVGSSSTNTELAIKSAVGSIDSRSGHTTVLSEDGTSLIILGGWVGDLNQAASPQLAVLDIGASYGGNGDWKWVVPDTQPSGPGIYGHGAALLPGNVMMVYGGYNISSAGTKARRQASSNNDVPMFLNLTSMSWSNDYTNPTDTMAGQDNSSNATDGDLGLRLGLGLGLGLGIAAIIVAIVFYLLYRRHLRHRRTIRDSAIRALAQDTSRFLPHDDEMVEHDHAWYTGGSDPYMRGSRSLGYQSLQANRDSIDQGRNSWFGGGPAQGQGVLRKPLPRRNTYDPPSGVIHPIAEADEDDGDITSEPISPLRDEARRDSDPFLTPTHTQEKHERYEKYDTPIALPQPTRASQTPSPERTTDPEVQDWMSDVEAMDVLLSGRRSAQQSPTRWALNRLTGEDERTESNVSESNRSNLNLNLNTNTAVTRSDSIRSHLRAGFGVAAAALAAAIDEGRGGSSSSSTPSYNTARSSFPALQAEGPGLLMGGRMRGGDRARDREEEPGSPSKSKPRRSLFGSLRRVFSGATPDASPIERYGRETRDDTEGEASDYDARLGGLSGIAAGGVLRRKSGRGDWETVEQSQPIQSLGRKRTSKRNSKGKGAADEEFIPRIGDDDDEWDIEKAVEKRLVQVMFTVPKEPLRVVNAEPDQIESGEDVMLVDPEEESIDDEPGGVIVEAEAMRTNLEVGDKKVEEVEERDLGTLIPTPSPVSEDDILREVREELEAEWKLDKGKGREEKRSEDESKDEDRGRQPETPVRTPRNLRDESARLLGKDLSTESRKRKPSRSPVEDPDGDVFSAQAVKLERPKTRVLAMVESFESLSRENSPSGSPTR